MNCPGLESFGICPECGRRALLRFTGWRHICVLCWERLFNNGDGGVKAAGGNA